MEATSWNLHHGSYVLGLTPWKLPHGMDTMEATSSNVHHGSYVVNLAPSKLPNGTKARESS